MARAGSWAIPEITSFSLSPRDRILWILADNGGKMERSRLRARTGMRYAVLNPILEELVIEGRVRIITGKDGDLVSLTGK
jgi:predicted transcriptional regulator